MKPTEVEGEPLCIHGIRAPHECRDCFGDIAAKMVIPSLEDYHAGRRRLAEVEGDRVKYLSPRDREPVWLLMFDDVDRGYATYHSEAEGREAFARASVSWTCTLLAPMLAEVEGETAAMSEPEVKVLDLHRLKTFINERIKESRRWEQSAINRSQDSIASAHHHSAAVGESILAEISSLEIAASKPSTAAKEESHGT